MGMGLWTDLSRNVWTESRGPLELTTIRGTGSVSLSTLELELARTQTRCDDRPQVCDIRFWLGESTRLGVTVVTVEKRKLHVQGPVAPPHRPCEACGCPDKQPGALFWPDILATVPGGLALGARRRVPVSGALERHPRVRLPSPHRKGQAVDAERVALHELDQLALESLATIAQGMTDSPQDIKFDLQVVENEQGTSLPSIVRLAVFGLKNVTLTQLRQFVSTLPARVIDVVLRSKKKGFQTPTHMTIDISLSKEGTSHVWLAAGVLPRWRSQ